MKIFFQNHNFSVLILIIKKYGIIIKLNDNIFIQSITVTQFFALHVHFVVISYSLYAGIKIKIP